MREADFTLKIEHSGDVKLLFITDMQIIDANQRRFPERLGGSSLTNWVPEKNEYNIYRFVRELVERSKPDLILITGDIIYGEFDDSGSSFTEYAAFMDSFKIPWAPVYGNHDNESRKGAEWQNEMFINSEYCLFAKGDVFGNGNYTIDIEQGGETIRRICMVDSNGCHGAGVSQGWRPDQLEWLEGCGKDNCPSFVCMHIPSKDFEDAAIAAGYVKEYDRADDWAKYDLDKNPVSPDADFGVKRENFDSSVQPTLMPILKKIEADGVFAGHYHLVNTSIKYEGVRFTLVTKTGLYDYHNGDIVGGTLATLSGKSFAVEHLYCKI